MTVLIVSFYFPPYGGVGARRWAKFSKYLSKAGVKTHVLAANFDGNSPWTKDIKELEERTTRIDLPKRKQKYFCVTPVKT